MGRPRISTAFTKVNTVALTPMPSARATAATSVNHLSFRSRRAANRNIFPKTHVHSLQGRRVVLDTLTD